MVIRFWPRALLAAARMAATEECDHVLFRPECPACEVRFQRLHG